MVEDWVVTHELYHFNGPDARKSEFPEVPNRTHAGAEINLVVDRGQTRIGLEFKYGVSASAGDWGHLKAGIAEGIIHKGFLVPKLILSNCPE